jgi:hypothetical protein
MTVVGEAEGKVKGGPASEGRERDLLTHTWAIKPQRRGY